MAAREEAELLEGVVCNRTAPAAEHGQEVAVDTYFEVEVETPVNS